MTPEEQKTEALTRLHELEDAALNARARESNAVDGLKALRKASQKAQRAYLEYQRWCRDKGYA